MIWANMPYLGGTLCDHKIYPNGSWTDPEINVTSHEHMEMVTDPYVNLSGYGAWYETSPKGWEIGDKCNFDFGPTFANGATQLWNSHYYLVQREWSDISGACVNNGP
jgi:hypothetical protein